MENDDGFAGIEERLMYTFEDRRLLERALTHSSYAHEELQESGRERHPGDHLVNSYERLEFLGDAVLELVVSDLLFSRFTGATEGELSRFRASMVNTESLTGLAKKLRLDVCLRLGKGEESSGGREKPSILAAVYEALIAAIYLDGGFQTAYTFACRHMSELLEELSSKRFLGDFKTPLQEKIQATLKTTPVYQVVAERGPDHMKTFEVELWIKGKSYGRGTGRSKKEAEQEAAKQALQSGRFDE
ncbi:MAG: ribonuclease III [bacterium]